MDEFNEKVVRMSSALRLLVVASATVCVGAIFYEYNYSFEQVTSIAVFTLIITAATMFWDFHVPIAFVGIGLLLVCDVMDIPAMIASSNLDVILFLMGMMVIIGVLRDLGLFSWIIIKVISMPSL